MTQQQQQVQVPTLPQLVEQRTQLLLQRSVAKDQVENADKALQTLGFAIQILEAQAQEAAASQTAGTAEE